MSGIMGITQVKAREPKFNPLNRHCGRTLTLRFLQGGTLATSSMKFCFNRKDPREVACTFHQVREHQKTLSVTKEVGLSVTQEVDSL